LVTTLRLQRPAFQRIGHRQGRNRAIGVGEGLQHRPDCCGAEEGTGGVVDQHRLVGRAVGEGGQAGLDGEGASRAAGVVVQPERPSSAASSAGRAWDRPRSQAFARRRQQGFGRPAQHGFPARTRHCLAWPGPALVPEPAATMTAEKVMGLFSRTCPNLSREEALLRRTIA
jgi:hypothetical protein